MAHYDTSSSYDSGLSTAAMSLQTLANLRWLFATLRVSPMPMALALALALAQRSEKIFIPRYHQHSKIITYATLRMEMEAMSHRKEQTALSA